MKWPLLWKAFISMGVFLVIFVSPMQAGEKKGPTVELTTQERQWLFAPGREIRVGITVIPPQILFESGTYKGLSLDYIHLLEQKLGYQFTLVPYPTWNDLLEAARLRKVDIVFAAQKTPDRLQYLCFSEPYIDLPNIILVRKDKQGGENLLAMTGWTVAASAGSAVFEFLQRKFPDLVLRPVPSEREGLEKVSLGEVDAMVLEISRASYYIEKQGILNLRVAGDAQFLYHLSFAVRSDWPQLCSLINKALGAVSDKEKNDISRRWIIVGEQNILTSRKFQTIAAISLLAFIIVISGIMVWNILLRKKVRQRTAQLEMELAERKQIEAVLRDSEMRFRTLFEQSIDAIAIMESFPPAFRYVNPAFVQLFGYTEEEVRELTGERIWSLVHPEDLPMVQASLKRRMELQETSVSYEFRIVRKDGEFRWVEAIGHRTQMGEKTINFSIYRDITSRKNAEEEQRQMEMKLQQAQKMESIGRLAGGVAHDFNNKLSVILGYTEMILDQLWPGKQNFNELLEIQKAAQHSADITRQLLAFARKQTIAPRVLELNRAVESMLQMLRRLIGEDIDLRLLPGKNLGQIKIDPSQIDQILVNLCVNARDSITGAGRISIETVNITFDEKYCTQNEGYTPGEYVMLAVSDNGCGMDEQTKAQIFEPFFTTKDVDKGTGLGLATVYGIVKQNNGLISFDSELGQGTTFRIYFPRFVSPLDFPPNKGRESGERQGSETILLVEDEPVLLKMTKTLLEKMGYQVLGANSPSEAIRLARDHSKEIQLLMTDVIMPEMNGRDLAKNLLAQYPGMKMLFMSGYTADVIAHHGVLDEGIHFIQKPFSKNELGAKIRESLDGSKSKRPPE